MRKIHLAATAVFACAITSTSVAEITAIWAHPPPGSPRQGGAAHELIIAELYGQALQQTWLPGTLTFGIGFTITCGWSQVAYHREQERSQTYYGEAWNPGGNGIGLEIAGQYPLPWTTNQADGYCDWCSQTFRGIASEETTNFVPGLFGSSIAFTSGNQRATDIDSAAVQVCRPHRGPGGTNHC